MYYNFIDDNGNTIEKCMSYEEFCNCKVTEDDGSTAFIIDKIKYKRDYKAEKDGFNTYPQNWPLLSQSMGCHPDQIPEMESYARSQGVDLQYDKATGKAICRDKKHWKEVMKLNGMYDKDAYY